MACNSGDWAYLANSFGDSPCVVAQKILQNFDQPCPDNNVPGHLPTQGQYPIPARGSDSLRCQCSAAYYYAVSACALCQGAKDYPTFGTWTSNCGGVVRLPPYDNNPNLKSVLPQYALSGASAGTKFVDPHGTSNPPPTRTPVPPTTPPPTITPTATAGPTSTPGDDGDDDTSSTANSSSASSSSSSSGSSGSSTSTTTDSSTDSSTSTLTSPASLRLSGGLATGTAGFSADPNDPNNPSPSISPLDGSSNSGNGTGALGERKGNNAGAIVGGVIGAIAFLILLGGAIYWFRTRRRRGSLAPSAAYMAAYGRPETVMSQRPYTDRSNTPLHSMYPEAHSPYSDDLRESVHSYNMEGVTGYNGPQRNISPQQYSPTR